MKYFLYLLLLQTVFWAGCEKSDGENGPATRVIRITPQELTGKENTAVEKHHHHHD